MKQLGTLLLIAFTVVLVGAFAAKTVAQSLIAGDIAGTVFDPSKAIVQDAKVSLKSLDTGAVMESQTTADGYFRFSLLKPGRYEITVSKAGFANLAQNVDVNVGKTTMLDLTLEISSAAVAVEVTAATELVNTDTSVSTTFTQQEVAKLPNPGGDVTNIAFTAPGVAVAIAQPGNQGYGNFTANGLPATSNLFTTNGENTMDPYFNINNTGATNLTLGSNEVQEATVITNPYSGQYGQLSGAQVNFITKSGTNAFHGNAQYWWNGRYLNANDFFNKWQTPAGTPNPAPFGNANQWATALGGPVIKDKTFFFVDYEGMRFVLPSSTNVYIPTPAFASAVLSNVQNLQPAEYSTYQKLFQLYANAPGAANATSLPSDSYCKALALPGFNGNTQSCVANFLASPTALATEWIVAARVDQRMGNNDNLFGRFKIDHGLQPSHVDPINSAFSALSNQPSWDVQVNESHSFSSTKTNVFTAAGSHYVAQFAQNHQIAASTFPYDVVSSGYGSSVPFSEVNPLRAYPQGRNITQYQFIDDFSWYHGRHTLKFGANFRRYDVSDHNFFYTSPTIYFGYTGNGLQQFADGLAYQYRQNSTLANNVPIAMWGLGLYAEDQIKVKPNFTLTLALRAERNSNPVCQKNCFANFTGSFEKLASYNSANPLDVPYSQDIKFNQHSAFPGVDTVVWSPRVAFSWAPGTTEHFPFFAGGGKTVISGGFGIFYDNPAVGLIDDYSLNNPPVQVTFRVRPASGVLPFDPAGGAATWQAAANAFDINKSFNQIQASMPAGVSFTPPAFNSIVGTVHAPRSYQWNFQIQQEIGRHTALSLNYVGNSVEQLPYSNSWVNAWDQYGILGAPLFPSNKAPDPAYGTVTQLRTGAVSNYNGLTVTVRQQIKSWIVAHFNYTYSHNLDEISNGGFVEYGFASGQSLMTQLNPTSLRAGNYGNSDYDIRHLISADYVLTPAFHVTNAFARHLVNGWEWSGKAYWHTGMPYSIVDGNITGAVGNAGGTFLATTLSGAPVQTGGCGQSAINTPCLNAGAFYDTFNNYLTAWPNQTRNQYHGAGYFDIDMGLFKTFKIKERLNFGVGMSAYNVFNHANMPFPNNTFSTGDSTFGTIVSGPAIGVPTSPYGNFLGFDSSPRIVQLSAKITF